MARDDEFDDDRPRRPRRRDDDDDPRRYDRGGPPKKSNAAMIVGIICSTVLLICGGGITAAWIGCNRAVNKLKEAGENIMKDAQLNMNKSEAIETSEGLKELGRQLDNFEKTNGFFPADSYNAAGKPLLSWRVHLLPFLNETDLYNKFKKDEPWDSPANRLLLKEMPDEYATSASRGKAGNEKTYFRGFSSAGAMFERLGPPNANLPRGRMVTGVTDGTSNTIMVFEAGDPIEWTKPDQLDFGPGKSPPAVGGISPQNPFFLVLMADGSVRKARRDINPNTFRALVNGTDGIIVKDLWESP
ncbi:DUF1559 family PulG-like putative transporter [Zavarzinella formosa]|uniref:DUF1559 family PulG-like putative transporter n=1 Tax=Zavarzinella formosa TaxID=360055 RepID=UPI00031BDCB9|nr:DUF1559 domain-containing protein [Zavarzinella formosa]